jgi:hypothetical protein
MQCFLQYLHVFWKNDLKSLLIPEHANSTRNPALKFETITLIIKAFNRYGWAILIMQGLVYRNSKPGRYILTKSERTLTTIQCCMEFDFIK